jgi:hypothetical protein
MTQESLGKFFWIPSLRSLKVLLWKIKSIIYSRVIFNKKYIATNVKLQRIAKKPCSIFISLSMRLLTMASLFQTCGKNGFLDIN